MKYVFGSKTMFARACKNFALAEVTFFAGSNKNEAHRWIVRVPDTAQIPQNVEIWLQKVCVMIVYAESPFRS